MKMTLAVLPIVSPMEKVFSEVVEIRFNKKRQVIYSENGHGLIRAFLFKYIGLHDPVPLRDSPFNSLETRRAQLHWPDYFECQRIIEDMDVDRENDFIRDDKFDGFYSKGLIIAPDKSVVAYQPRDISYLDHASRGVLESILHMLKYQVVGFDNLRNAEAIGHRLLEDLPHLGNGRVRNP